VSTRLLTAHDISMRFGGILALNDVDIEVDQGSITALVGPNGAGKTTLFNCLTGFYKPTDGRIFLHQSNTAVNLVEMLGEPFRWSDWIFPRQLLRRLRFKLFGGSYRVARAGIARTFQNIRLFQEMTVIENLLVAQHQLLSRNMLHGLFNSRHYQACQQAAIDRAFSWLEEINLVDEANRLAGDLPYGHQRRLEIARAMCTQPALVCLDEPAAGLNPSETQDLGKLINRLRDVYGVTILLIEHDMPLVMDLSDFIYVLDHGEVIAAGKPEEIRKDPLVLSAYLGTED